jgi:hypothetical protein
MVLADEHLREPFSNMTDPAREDARPTESNFRNPNERADGQQIE